MSPPKLPAMLFILRHCTRLDYVNPHWPSSSISPQNPPISCGGWLEGVELGHAIGELIKSHLNGRAAPTVTIYTAPAVRCLQSCAAFAVGLTRSLLSTGNLSAAGRFFSLEVGGQTIDSPAAEKPLLRTDLFLAEWSNSAVLGKAVPTPDVVLLEEAKTLGLPQDINGPMTDAAGPVPDNILLHGWSLLDADVQFDSLQHGAGGSFEESWDAMLMRFQRGMHKVLVEQSTHATGSDKPFAEAPSREQVPRGSHSEYQAAPEKENVVLFLTHGAGCTALIHALSGTPTQDLPYIKRSSLSMAVRVGSRETVNLGGEEGSRDASVLGLYRLDLINSLDHLPSGIRGGSQRDEE